MINIYTLTGNPSDGVSFYRCFGPFRALRKEFDGNLEIKDISDQQITWSTFTNCDILYVLRPALESQLAIIQYAKKMGVKIWIDYDDNLEEIPIHNKNYMQHLGASKVIPKILKEADYVTVSTVALFNKFFPVIEYPITADLPINIINNSLPDYLYKLPVEPRSTKPISVFWRGSQTHNKDLWDYNCLLKIIMENSDVKFYFMGDYPEYLSAEHHNVTYIESENTIGYFETLLKISPDFMIVPLSDNKFNHCKSNIALLEGTFAKAICLCPNWHEWKHPGVVNYKEPSDFYYKLTKLIQAKREKKTLPFSASNDYAGNILDSYNESISNAQRKSIINELTKKNIKVNNQTLYLHE